FSQLIGERGQRLKFTVNSQIPPLGNVERTVQHHVVLQNAVYRISQTERAWTRYLIFVFRYTAISDEKREGLIRFGFNLNNASTIDPFADHLLAATLGEEVTEAVVKPASGQLPADWTTAAMKPAVSRSLHNRVRESLGQFMQGMQRRLDRDLVRIHEYYSGLREEAYKKLKKGKGDSAREKLRIEATEREYQAKVADLKQKYDLRVKVEPVQTLELISPVERITLIIKR